MAEKDKEAANRRAERRPARDGTPPGRAPRKAEGAGAQAGEAPGEGRSEAKPEAKPTGAGPEGAPPKEHARGRSRAWIGLLILLLVLGAAGYGLWPFVAEKLGQREAEAPLKPEEAMPEGAAPPIALAPGAGEAGLPAGQTAPEELAPPPAPPVGTAALDKLLAENAALQSELVEVTARLRDLEQELSERAGPAAPSPSAVAALPGAPGAPAELSELDARLKEIETRLGESRTPGEAEARRAELAEGREEIGALGRRLAEIEAELARERAGSAQTLELFLAAQQLREALRVGAPFSHELALLKAAAGADKDVILLIEPIEADAAAGIPALSLLQARFAAVANRIVSAALAPEGSGWVDRTLERLASIVSVRRTGATLEGASAEAVAARAEAKLGEGNLAGAVGELEALEGKPLAAASAWLADARKRLAADAALDALDRLLVARLERASAAGPAP